MKYFIVIVVLILLILSFLVFVKFYKKESFANENKKGFYRKTNPLYNTGILYTQPPGDVKAQKQAGVGQGTDGSYFPLQGNGAQIMMLNSDDQNQMIPSKNDGSIGGYPNYTDKILTSWMNGFNNFGKPFIKHKSATKNTDYSNSYLIDGSNERVENPGQDGHLKCQDWWPKLNRNSQGVCTTDNSSIATCKNALSCGDTQRFIESKMNPQWKNF